MLFLYLATAVWVLLHIWQKKHLLKKSLIYYKTFDHEFAGTMQTYTRFIDADWWYYRWTWIMMITDNSAARSWTCNETWICNEGGAWVTCDVSSVRSASFSFSQGSDLRRVRTRSGRARILRTEWLGIVDKWGPWNGKHISGCWFYSGFCRLQVRRVIFTYIVTGISCVKAGGLQVLTERVWTMIVYYRHLSFIQMGLLECVKLLIDYLDGNWTVEWIYYQNLSIYDSQTRCLSLDTCKNDRF